ncbi:hypothetical protein GCM10010270_80800 [Streptomyces violaceus]|nr:hypothetical protein GCM10010270_80800 [Streptomyces janthinus]
MTTMTPQTRRPMSSAAPELNWRDSASCREVDPELFFPIGTSGPALVQTEQAKSVCGGCPSQQACLSWALDTGQHTGVWGGLSEDERYALRGRTRQHRTSDDGRPAWQVIVESRLEEYRALEAAGLRAWEIGRRMRTNAHTINRVRMELARAQAQEVAAA